MFDFCKGGQSVNTVISPNLKSQLCRLKGTIARDGFLPRCILSEIERKDFNLRRYSQLKGAQALRVCGWDFYTNQICMNR